MNAATERISDMLRARDWNFEVDEDSQMVNTGFHGQNGQWRVTAGGFNDLTILILSHFPVDCPPPHRPACAEALTRINYGLSTGSFEMDYDTGRIHFKTSRAYPDQLPSPEELDFLLTVNLRSMDHYLPTIMQVIYAGASPAKAVAALDAADARAQRARQTKVKPTCKKLMHRSRFQTN